MTAPKVFTAADPWPDFGPGTVVAVNYGDYRTQEVWVASGPNVGNWYPLGGEFGRGPKVAEDPRTPLQKVWHPPPGTIPLHPHWADVVARGPVTLLVAAQDAAYTAGWRNGRRRLYEQVESLRDEEDGG